jgi:hypothetical protein
MPDNSKRMHVYVALNAERDYQDQKHGDHTQTHHKHTPMEWVAIMEHYLNEAKAAFTSGKPTADSDTMDAIRKVTASGVCCMEQNGVVYREDSEPKCDVCGDTFQMHQTEKGYDHEFGGIAPVSAATPRSEFIGKLNREYTPEGDAALSRLKKEVQSPGVSTRITDPARLAELREMNSYTGQPDRCEACGSSKRAPGLCCIVCGKPSDDPIMLSDFRKDIESTINRYSKENGSNTPDFILAQYLVDSLGAYDKAVTAREKWYGREPKPVPPDQAPPPPPDVVGKPFLSSI